MLLIFIAGFTLILYHEITIEQHLPSYGLHFIFSRIDYRCYWRFRIYPSYPWRLSGGHLALCPTPRLHNSWGLVFKPSRVIVYLYCRAPSTHSLFKLLKFRTTYACEADFWKHFWSPRYSCLYPWHS